MLIIVFYLSVLRSDQHLWVVPAPVARLPKPHRPPERRRSSHVPPSAWGVQAENQRFASTAGNRPPPKNKFRLILQIHAVISVSSPPEYIQKYATEEALKEQEEGAGDSSSESSMSDFSEDEAQDMEL